VRDVSLSLRARWRTRRVVRPRT